MFRCMGVAREARRPFRNLQNLSSIFRPGSIPYPITPLEPSERLETLLVDASPVWLTRLTTKF